MANMMRIEPLEAIAGTAETKLKNPDRNKAPKASQRRPIMSKVNTSNMSAGNSRLDAIENITKRFVPRFRTFLLCPS
jgi:hypothetical protein